MTAHIQTTHHVFASGETCCRITLNAPRANALEPRMLAELRVALETLAESGVQKALIAGGRNFSSGGDVGRFWQAAQEGQAEKYAETVVPALQDCVMRMIEMPVLIAVAARGATTGGAAGLVFAADMAVLSPDAFMQPYYSVMGFAPDGGWTATLPEKIGLSPAHQWLLTNHRCDAHEAVAKGLAQAVDTDPEALALTLLERIEIGSGLAAKSLLWDAVRRKRVRARLDAEAAAFQRLIGREETKTRMTSFLSATG